MSTKEQITIKGARENNLKNVSLTLPKNKLIVFTGLSGSGKSSLAFNTIYEEGRRRYVDSLSSYARQFLGGTNKPDVDAIDGLSPSIAIEQKTTHNNPRSTVGTVTEIYDYLRLLFARIGKPFCPRHKIEIKTQTNKDILDTIYSLGINTKIIILSPIVDNEKGTHANLIEKLRKEGFLRLKIDGEIQGIDDINSLDKNTKHTIDIVVDRVNIDEENRSRIAEAISVAAEYSKGLIKVETVDGEVKTFSKLHSCMYKDFEMPKIEPRLFSFNAPMGACAQCKGLGVDLKASFDALVPEPWRTINDGAIKIFANTVNTTNLEWQAFDVLLNHYNIDKNVPIEELSNEDLKIIKYGSKEEIEYVLVSASGAKYRHNRKIEGILTSVERKYMETTSEAIRDWLRKYMGSFPCSKCNNSRLNEYALAVQIDGINIDKFSRLSVDDALLTIENMNLDSMQQQVSSLILSELINRLTFLQNVGLGYLTLNRSAETLSGGESQRIKLATQVGSNLTGILYVLDEPSIGLHQKDNERLISTLKNMVEIGNTLIVVEHDEDTIKAAEHIVDIGPEQGVKGGFIVAEGSIQDIMNSPDSLTGQYLSGKRRIEVPQTRRSGNGQVVTVIGAKENNLKNIDVKFPLGKFIAVTGVSGSGKSTLVNEIFVKGIQRVVNKSTEKMGKFSSISNIKAIDKVVPISQSPIGRTPRSTPATHISVFDDIRDLFASTPEAQSRGYTKSNFSFNVPGGRCEKCSGDGSIRIEMHFLPDVYIACDECDGRRYTLETREVKYRGKNIADVLEMSVDEAYEFFQNRPKIKEKLGVIQSIGLGYIKLGQPSTTLSGGEAQRVKLATYLHKKATGKTVYVLDEPTTGLHPYDVHKLLGVLNKIVDNGDTVVVIEHNLDVIKCADYIIDLGPDGGVNGGKIVASGTPEQVAKIEGSYTGEYLKKYL
ncbi:excinuclease ABC subunit A [Mycoplasmopsis californica HAZ160_1]|uniref:UvrABC system protein A n=1 Tax=Mycoplasmopsis californica HAZ160_1 TaxID=1397850 RepID=A0AAT9F8G4_9BACT|nr:excinuclease ABC subunit UvrA [Mycoplasmopsis californica]BAP01208.1 excinuclease ABC subunit A [Mycoplasmopsis californica HAZ160_1]BBG41079.1 excinuclease ABC subunit A [Mycoplasmopsis californica]BBG41672.1 excinuclease ABC subunit A [Mycoplasmopsis californica]BBG42266.1 excinuclease ABC subunit A [Mycoplasmopsis californica]BBG42843.1 excinuclease ABC subunit A [Mycoplasmopsis californica]